MTVLPDVVEEHAEEASFLYDQRAYLTRTLQAGWRRLEPIERRIERTPGRPCWSRDPRGPEAVGERACPGSPGRRSQSAVLAARTDRPERISARSGTRSLPKAGRDALVHGLTHETRPSWERVWTSSLAGDGPLPAWVAAHVIGRGLLPLGPALLARLDRDADPQTMAACVGALGRLRLRPRPQRTPPPVPPARPTRPFLRRR